MTIDPAIRKLGSSFRGPDIAFDRCKKERLAMCCNIIVPRARLWHGFQDILLDKRTPTAWPGSSHLCLRQDLGNTSDFVVQKEKMNRTMLSTCSLGDIISYPLVN